MNLRSDDSAAIRSAFPRRLASEVDSLLAVLPVSIDGVSIETIGAVIVDGEPVRIPYRVHWAPLERAALESLSESQALMVQCIYSRHHDGWVRERALTAIVRADEDWTPPFIVQLASEYVVEIIQIILDNIDIVGTTSFRRFASTNASFVSRCRQRTVSYWDHYYRTPTPRYRNYPGFRVLDAVMRAAQR